MKPILIFIAFLFTINLLAAQTNIPGGNVSGTLTLSGSPYIIQGSIRIPNDSTLTIEPGVRILFQSSTYKLLVSGRILAIGTISDTIIFTATDTTNGWRGIRFDNTANTNDTSKLIFCKIQYGKATGISPEDKGGAIYINNFSKVVVSNSNISNNSASSFGGGIYCNANSFLINNSVVSNNYSEESGGGIYCVGNTNIQGNKIYNNYANSGAARGGGIFCKGNQTIKNNHIFNNIGIGSGGGIYCEGGSPTITYNNIHNNISPSNYGGGIACAGDNLNAIIKNNFIANNTGGYGGGIGIDGGNFNINTVSNIQVENDTLVNNTAVGGGGISCTNVINHINNNIIFRYNVIANNTANATSGIISGGGIACYNSSPTIDNNLLINNYAIGNSGGGALYLGSSNAKINNNSVSNNSATKGGALYTVQSSPTIINTIFWGNTSTGSISQIFLFDEASDPNFYYCNVGGGSNSIDANGNFYTGVYSNNINTNPLFLAPTLGSGLSYNGLNGNWALQNISPCINTGNPIGNYPSLDIAGNVRVSGGLIDMGAYEYQTTSLPVTLVDFSALFKNRVISLHWTTVDEVNFYKFEIEKSLGDNSWFFIGLKLANGLSGENNYAFDDKSYFKGINYYRLKMIDKDGNFKYSEIKSVNVSERQIFDIAPNPASSFTNISFFKPISNAIIKVYDVNGKLVLESNISSSSTTSYKLKTDTLLSGVYIISITTAYGFHNQKLIITK
jgi:predicted outer membrane repeat protein